MQLDGNFYSGNSHEVHSVQRVEDLKSMSVYIVIYQKIVDVARFTEYIHAVMPAIKRRGGRLIAQRTPEAFEGLVSYQRAVLFEW